MEISIHECTTHRGHRVLAMVTTIDTSLHAHRQSHTYTSTFTPSSSVCLHGNLFPVTNVFPKKIQGCSNADTVNGSVFILLWPQCSLVGLIVNRHDNCDGRLPHSIIKWLSMSQDYREITEGCFTKFARGQKCGEFIHLLYDFKGPVCVKYKNTIKQHQHMFVWFIYLLFWIGDQLQQSQEESNTTGWFRNITRWTKLKNKSLYTVQTIGSWTHKKIEGLFWKKKQ